MPILNTIPIWSHMPPVKGSVNERSMGKGKKSKRERASELEWGGSRLSSKPPTSVTLPIGGDAVLPPADASGGIELGGEQRCCFEPPLLEVRTLMEDCEGDSMLVASPVLTPAECAEWISWGERTGFALEKHAATAHIAHRDNGRLAIQSDELARAIFARLEPWIPSTVGGARACGCNPNLRLYRYVEGQRFGPHIDQANRLDDGSITAFTVLLYLNDDGLQGGETIFYEDGRRPESEAAVLRFAPRAGAALVHSHGDRCLTHEGAPVSRGTKYLLRTDVAYR